MESDNVQPLAWTTLERKILAPAACFSYNVTRRRSEPDSPVRTPFQRDRDRVIHCQSFRRLMHKTQVFIAPSGDHFRTRLTHTLEVTQIARTIGRALRLNEDLIEAIGLAHDLGHTPFGHAGERVLAAELGQFRHNEQSLRIVDILEKDGAGLNLTEPVRNGILNHSKSGANLGSTTTERPGTLEGEVVKLSDAIAYINHDLDDALQSGIIDFSDLPTGVEAVLGGTHGERINTLVLDVIQSSRVEDAPGQIAMSDDVSTAANTLRDFLYEHVYNPLNERPDAVRAQHVVHELFRYYVARPEAIPTTPLRPIASDPVPRQVADYVASLTDRFAIEVYEQLFVPRSWSL